MSTSTRIDPVKMEEPGNQHGNRSREQRARESIQGFTLLLDQARIIPAVRSPAFLVPSSLAPGKIVYFLFGNPENTAQMMELIADAGKVPIINIDLAAGFARDHAAVSYLAHHQVQGIISTHPEPLRAARDLGLFAIKRTFLLDSAALESALRSLDQFMPDALEVLPALAAPHIVHRLHQMYPTLPVIAGGLITTLREIEDLVSRGISAVSVSDYRLWVA
jgi:glycerol uptake operon antiterminator